MVVGVVGEMILQVSFNDIKTGHEVARIACGDEEIGQSFEGVDVIPVEEVSMPFLEAYHRVYDVTHPFHGFLMVNKAEL